MPVKIAVTGAAGFIGRNLILRLQERGYEDIRPIVRSTDARQLAEAIGDADIVFHLAGTNRPKHPEEFASGNTGATQALCNTLLIRPIPVVYASSTQAALDNPYGKSKRDAEDALLSYGRDTQTPVHIFRLTNVFGKWARANYNSAVATFCYNVARDLPISINDQNAPLRLLYVDDVVDAFIDILAKPLEGGFVEAGPVYDTTVGEVARIIRSFAESRQSLLTPPVGTGLPRALHATYLSYLDPSRFDYTVPVHADARGEFVEMLKTKDSGQTSYFTAHPGITRGEHYHHTKTEKFLVIRGTARFSFRNLDTGEKSETIIRGGEARIVETAPGWAHNVTNIGEDELICMLWANEVFDRQKPDTIPSRVDQ